MANLGRGIALSFEGPADGLPASLAKGGVRLVDRRTGRARHGGQSRAAAFAENSIAFVRRIAGRAGPSAARFGELARRSRRSLARRVSGGSQGLLGRGGLPRSSLRGHPALGQVRACDLLRALSLW